MWAEYKLSADQAGMKAAAYTMFCSLWHQLVPHVTVMKPMIDLYWVCQQFSVAIMRIANTPESAKSQVYRLVYTIGWCDSQVLKDAEEHLQLATQERSYYRSAIAISKEALRQMFTINGCLLVPPVPLPPVVAF